MTEEIGAKWFELIFLANCGEARPPLLILDSHSSHEIFELLDMAMKKRYLHHTSPTAFRQTCVWSIQQLL